MSNCGKNRRRVSRRCYLTEKSVAERRGEALRLLPFQHFPLAEAIQKAADTETWKFPPAIISPSTLLFRAEGKVRPRQKANRLNLARKGVLGDQAQAVQNLASTAPPCGSKKLRQKGTHQTLVSLGFGIHQGSRTIHRVDVERQERTQGIISDFSSRRHTSTCSTN